VSPLTQGLNYRSACDSASNNREVRLTVMILAGVSLLNVCLPVSLVFLLGVLFACFFSYTFIHLLCWKINVCMYVLSVKLVTIGGQH